MEQPASVDFEDHKADFSTAAEPGEVPVRLNSPSKKQLGVIAEAKLQKLNDQVRRVTGAQQWRETRHAPKWFEGLPKPSRGKECITSFNLISALSIQVSRKPYSKKHSNEQSV